jgi:hypothetical protein
MSWHHRLLLVQGSCYAREGHSSELVCGMDLDRLPSIAPHAWMVSPDEQHDQELDWQALSQPARRSVLCHAIRGHQQFTVTVVPRLALPPSRSFTIATHPDVQQRAREELQAAGLLHTDTQPARELTYDDLARLTYLNCTIDETMRMYPVAATASVR